MLTDRSISFLNKTNCSNMATIGEIGEYPLMLRAWLVIITFWHRTTQMGDITLAKKATKFLMENDHSESEWISTVRIILKKLGLERYFEQPSDITTEKLKELLSKKLHEKFSQEWSTSILSQTGSLRFYKTFKSDFSREKYLEFVSCYKLRKVISKLRCSDHMLELEIGRRKKIVENERKCQVCMIEVESEVHFRSVHHTKL